MEATKNGKGYFSLIPEEENNKPLIKRKCCLTIVHYLDMDFMSNEIEDIFC